MNNWLSGARFSVVMSGLGVVVVAIVRLWWNIAVHHDDAVLQEALTAAIGLFGVSITAERVVDAAQTRQNGNGARK